MLINDPNPNPNIVPDDFDDNNQGPNIQISGDVEAFDFDDEDEGDAPNPNPNPESNNGNASAPLAFIKSLEDGRFEFGDRQFTAEELEQVLNAGIDPTETNRAATQRFQEASEIRKGIDTAMQEYSQIRELAQGLAALPPERQQLILSTVDALVKGEPAPSAVTANPNLPFNVPQGFKPENFPKFDELSEEAQTIVAAFMPQMEAMRQQLANMGQVIPEVRSYIGETKLNAQVTDAQAQIKAEFGLDATPAELTQAVKDTGIADPHKAWVFANRTKIASQAATQAAQAAAAKPKDVPGGSAKTFNPKGMTADQIAYHLTQGFEMEKPKSR